MVDNQDVPPPADNIRTLLYHLGTALDERLTLFRRGTPYEKVRPSDVRVFVAAARQPSTISEIARALKVTRQAVQASVHRLQEIKVLDLQAIPGNQRDKHVVVTARGMHARNTASQQIQQFEKEFAAVIGEEDLEKFRINLICLLDATRDKNKADSTKVLFPV
jgi:DNA-binding MarR family transcriptional regulator